MFMLQYCEEGVVKGVVLELDKTPKLFDTKEDAKNWLSKSLIEAMFTWQIVLAEGDDNV